MTSRPLFCLFVLSAFCTTPLFAGGAKLTITTRNNQEISGELLYAKDSTLIISTQANVHTEILKKHPEYIVKVERKDILEIRQSGESFLTIGIILGFAAGIAIGTLVSYEPESGGDLGSSGSNFNPNGSGAKMLIYCGAGGASLGALAGGTAATKDHDLDLNHIGSFTHIENFSRYGGHPPDFIERLFSK